MAEHEPTILLVSALPPPAGGVATQTEILARRGLPTPFRLTIVNTTVGERHVFSPSRFSWSEMGRALRILAGVGRGLFGREIRLVHLNFTPTRNGVWRDALLIQLARLFRTPVVAQVHSDLSEAYVRDWPRVSRRLLRSVLRHATRVLVLTEGSAGWVRDRAGCPPPLIVPNFVEQASEPPERAPTDRPTALFVGALSRKKGVFDLLEAVARVPNLRCELVGSPLPEDAAELEERVSALETAGRVVRPGRLTNREVRERMRAADLFVLPSHLEAFPISVLEAMAEGLPVVASAVGALPEIVEEPTGGLLVPPGDAIALAAALDRLAKNADERSRMGRFNRRRVRDRYAFEAVAGRLAGVYEAVLTGSKEEVPAERARDHGAGDREEHSAATRDA